MLRSTAYRYPLVRVEFYYLVFFWFPEECSDSVRNQHKKEKGIESLVLSVGAYESGVKSGMKSTVKIMHLYTKLIIFVIRRHDSVIFIMHYYQYHINLLPYRHKLSHHESEYKFYYDDCRYRCVCI